MTFTNVQAPVSLNTSGLTSSSVLLPFVAKMCSLHTFSFTPGLMSENTLEEKNTFFYTFGGEGHWEVIHMLLECVCFFPSSVQN